MAAILMPRLVLLLLVRWRLRHRGALPHGLLLGVYFLRPNEPLGPMHDPIIGIDRVGAEAVGEWRVRKEATYERLTR